MRTRIVCIVLTTLTLSLGAAQGGPGRLHPSVEKDALCAIDLGLRWLEKQQQEKGNWSVEQFPAITALVAQAYLNAPDRKPMEVKPHVAKGLAFIMSCVREDGGIYCDIPRPRGGGLRNYNTAICMTALAASGDTTYDPVVRKARAFMLRMQHLGDDVYNGGMGYDGSLDRAYADMANTIIAVEAMKFTRFVEDRGCVPPLESIKDRPRAKEEETVHDLNWAAAQEFLAECQNLRIEGKSSAVSPREEDRGGFYYEPNRGQTQGGKDAQGRPTWYSYGTATYGGLMCLLFADVKREDPRVQEAVGWIRRHWTLEEHPGQGPQGMYFYYHTVAKALRAYGADSLTLPDGTEAEWRTQLAMKLCTLQKKDPKTGLGYWVNDNGRWMENDPVLVTAYALLALEMAVSETAP